MKFIFSVSSLVKWDYNRSHISQNTDLGLLQCQAPTLLGCLDLLDRLTTDCDYTKTILSSQGALVSCLALTDYLSPAVMRRLIFKVSLFQFLAWETAMSSLRQTAGSSQSNISPSLPTSSSSLSSSSALQSWNSENYFTSDWKGDTWKIFLYLAEYFPGPVLNVQCVVS